MASSPSEPETVAGVYERFDSELFAGSWTLGRSAA